MDNEQTHNITLTGTELGWVIIALWDSERFNKEEGWHGIAKTMQGLAERMSDIRMGQDLDRV